MAATIEVAVAGGPNAPAFTVLSLSPLGETDDMYESRLSVGRDAHMLSVRLVQTGASATTNLYAIELDARPYSSATGPSQNP